MVMFSAFGGDNGVQSSSSPRNRLWFLKCFWNVSAQMGKNISNLTNISKCFFQISLFSTLPGEMIQFDEHIFQMGWFLEHRDPLILVSCYNFYG